MAVIFTIAAPAVAQEEEGAFSEFVVFGDSLSDPGNIPGATGGANFPPPPYSANRFSNGPTWTELLPELLGIEGPVTNRAFGGAFTGQLPTPVPLQAILGPTTGNLNAITQGPTINALFALDNTDIRSQVTGYLQPQPVIAPDALFSVFGGGNDYFLAASAIAANPANAQAIASAAISQAVGNISASADTLARSGARHIIVPNLPNLGATPQFAGNPQQALLGSTISNGHNTLLNFAMSGLASQHEANFYVVDFASLFADGVANPSKYGFANVTAPCFTGVTVCANPDSFAFWDNVHPTAAGHRLMAAFAADTVLAPRTLAAQGFVGLANAGAAQRQLTSALRATRHVTEGRFVFADLSYDDASRDSVADAVGYDYNGYTLSAGMAGRPLANVVVGALLGYTVGETDLAGEAGEFDLDSVRLGGFLGAELGPVVTSLAVSYTNDEYSSISRETGVAAQVAEADGSGSSLAATLEALYPFGGAGLTIAPLARVRLADVTVNGYVEHGAVGLDQSVSRRNVDSVDAELGGELSGQAGGARWRLEGVYVEPLDEAGQVVTSALVTVPGVPRTLRVAGDEEGYARFGGAGAFDLGGVSLEVGGESTVERDLGEDWSVYGRIGRVF
jgi:outer membrane lipase/esterase